MGQLIKFPLTQSGITKKSKPAKAENRKKLRLSAEVLFFTGVRYERQMGSLPSERLTAPFART